MAAYRTLEQVLAPSLWGSTVSLGPPRFASAAAVRSMRPADRPARRRRARRAFYRQPPRCGCGAVAPLGTVRAAVQPLAALAARGRRPVSWIEPAQPRTVSDQSLLCQSRTNCCAELCRGSRSPSQPIIMALRVLVLLVAHCAARPAPPRSLTLSGGAKKKAIKHGPRQCIRRRRRVTH